MKKIFLDANILIDLITGRETGFKHSDELLKRFPTKNLYISALTVHIVFYLLKLRYGDKGYQRVVNIIESLNVLPLDGVIVRKASQIDFKDFEDKLQYFSALKECDYIITRDEKDFRKLKEIVPSNIKIISSLKGVV